MYHTAEPVMKWHEANQQYLLNRRPLATVGVAWSQRNTDFYGQDRAAELVDAPYRGFTASLVRARIPYVPIHIDHLERDGGDLKVLILPDLAAMSDAQCESVRKFVTNGGALIATGLTSVYNEFGDARSDYGLAGVFGAHFVGSAAPENPGRGRRSIPTYASARSCGPACGDRKQVMNPASPANAIRCCVVSRKPTFCRSEESWRP